MENRERQILNAATQAFLRYGVKRTSMGDIAEEAGVARQTLYNFYSSKDDILRGSIRMFGEDARAEIEAGLAARHTVAEQIRTILAEMVVKPFIFLHSSPNAQDLIDGYNAAGRREIEANGDGFRRLLTQVFDPFAPTLADRNLTPDSLAEIVQRSATALKSQARDEAHVKRLMDGLQSMVTATLGID